MVLWLRETTTGPRNVRSECPQFIAIGSMPACPGYVVKMIRDEAEELRAGVEGFILIALRSVLSRPTVEA